MTNQVRKPKAPLSAYNLYFQVERKRILNGTEHLALRISHEEVGMVAAEHKAKDGKRTHRRTHGRIGFKELARVVAHRWKALDRATKRLLEHHARLQKREHMDLCEAYMTTEEYQLELQAKQLEASLQANPYHREGVSATAKSNQDMELFPAFHFQKTAALVKQGLKESDSNSEEAKSHSSSQCSILNQELQDEKYLEGNSDPQSLNNEFPPCSVNKFQWDMVIHDQEGPQDSIPEHKNLFSSESDLVMIVFMVDFHSSMFPGASSVSDLFDTSALNKIHQAEELFDM